MNKKYFFSGIVTLAFLIAGVFMIAAGPSEEASSSESTVEQANCVCPANSRTIKVKVTAFSGGCYKLVDCNTGAGYPAIATSTSGPLTVGASYKMCVVKIGNTICGNSTVAVICAQQGNC